MKQTYIREKKMLNLPVIVDDLDGSSSHFYGCDSHFCGLYAKN